MLQLVEKDNERRTAQEALQEEYRYETDMLRKKHDLAMSQVHKQREELKRTLQENSTSTQKELLNKDRKIQQLGNKVCCQGSVLDGPIF